MSVLGCKRCFFRKSYLPKQLWLCFVWHKNRHQSCGPALMAEWSKALPLRVEAVQASTLTQNDTGPVGPV